MFRKKIANSSDTGIKAVIFIILGLILIIYWSKDFISSFKEPAYLFEQKTEDIKKGAYLQEEIYAALDYFMYEETSRTKYGIELSSRTTSYYYIIPVLTEDAGDLYMAVEINARDEEKMSSICDNTYNYLMGELSDEEFISSTYHVTGKIRNMEQEELDYMVEWFQHTEYFGTTDTAEIMNYIHPVMLEKDNGSAARIIVILGAVFILIGAVILIVLNMIRRKKNESETILNETIEVNNSFSDTYAQPKNTYSQDYDFYNSTYDNQ